MADDITTMTAEIVSAYVVENKVSSEDLSALIKSVFQSLSTVNEPAAEPVAEGPAKATNAQIRKSITPDALISFEDGRPYKTLKRHLTKQGLTVAEYKAKWGLPNDYPTTSASYSATRSAMAKSLGLGTVRQAAPKEEPAESAPKATRPRKAKAAPQEA